MTFFAGKPQDVIGIDIGDSSVKTVHLGRHGMSMELAGYAIEPLPEEEISLLKKDKGLVADSLKKALARLGSGAKSAYICLNSSSVIIKRISLIPMPQDELRQAVELAAVDLAPFDTKDSLIDFQVLGQRDDAGVDKVDILVVIAEKATIDYHIDLLKSAGLKPAGITVDIFALEELFKQIDASAYQKMPLAVLDIGHLGSGLSIYASGKPQFVRALPVSGREFTEVMTGVLVSDQGKVQLSFDEAEDVKKSVGIPGEGAQPANQKISNTQLLSMIRPLLEELAVEIKRSFGYSKTQFMTEDAQTLYMKGSGAILKNLNTFLSERLGLEAAFLDMPQKLKINQASPRLKNFKEDYVHLASALASALDRCAVINLLPEELRQEKFRNIQKVSLKFVGLISFGFLLVSYLLMSAQTANLKKQLKIEKAHYKALGEIAVTKEKVDTKRQALRTLKGLRPNSHLLLRDLSSAIEDPIEVTSLSCDHEGKIVINGRIEGRNGEALLAGMMKKFSGIPAFKNAKVASIQKKNDKLYTYEIVCVSENSGR